MIPADPPLRLLPRLGEEGGAYVLVGGQAVRLNGFLRATEDIDLLVRASRENGERIKRALSFLESSKDVDVAWFDATGGEPENIRVADDLIADLLFTANGETYDSLQADVREIEIEGVRVRVLNIDGLLKTKTRTREKDILDRLMLERIRRELGKGTRPGAARCAGREARRTCRRCSLRIGRSSGCYQAGAVPLFACALSTARARRPATSASGG